MSDANFKPATIWTGDNLGVMRGMNDACIDLIYLDPPFNTNKKWEGTGDAKGTEFWDRWRMERLPEKEHKAFAQLEPAIQSAVSSGEATHSPAMRAYLTFMAVRLVEMHRILKPTGSIYLHCDPTASHYLKLVMDAVFGRRNFRNEIVWCYSRPSAPKQRQLSRVHDTIHWYSKGEEWTFHADAIRQPYAARSRSREGYAATASKVAEGTVQLDARGKFPESWVYIPPLKGNSKEYVGYPTQKPLALLERILKASSNPGDLVFDPFCGCATTLVAADGLGRQWVGCDINSKAAIILFSRLEQAQGETDTQKSWLKDVTATTALPARSDLLPDMHGYSDDHPAPQADKASEQEESQQDAEVKAKLFAEQKGYCNGCGQATDWKQFQTDHIVPKAKGGHDGLFNKQLLCQPCNGSKGSKDMDEWRAWARQKYGALIPFHGIAPRGVPREDLLEGDVRGQVVTTWETPGDG